MRTIVFACFASLGKSFAANKIKDCLDLDSTMFKWIYKSKGNIETLKGTTDREKNPDWPHNYQAEVIKNLGKYKYIFISLNAPEILQKLDELNIENYILLPKRDIKQTILERLKDRNNSMEFINSIDEKFDEILDYYKDFKNVIYLEKDQFVKDIIINFQDRNI